VRRWRPLLRAIGATALTLALAVEIFRVHAADRLAVRDPAAALGFDGRNAAAATLAAQNALATAKPDFPKVAAALRSLLAIDPLAPGALAVLGAAQAQTGDLATARRTMTIAAAHLPVDLLAQGWLYERAIATNDVGAAVDRLDLLLRGRPFIAEKAAPSVARLLAIGPAAEAALAKRLAPAPPWRKWLLERLPLDAPQSAPVVRLYDRLSAAGAPVGPDELRPLLWRLLRDGAAQEAQRAWRASLPPELRSSAPLLFNADLRRTPANLPFDWETPPLPGSAVAFDPRAGAIVVDFYGGRTPFAHLRHVLALPPGPYVFAGRESADNLQTPRGLRWTIACLDAPGALLGAGGLLAGDRTDAPFSIAFETPAQGCPAQILTLALDARIESETEISGTARFTALSLTRGGAPGGATPDTPR